MDNGTNPAGGREPPQSRSRSNRVSITLSHDRALLNPLLSSIVQEMGLQGPGKQPSPNGKIPRYLISDSMRYSAQFNGMAMIATDMVSVALLTLKGGVGFINRYLHYRPPAEMFWLARMASI